MVEQEDSQATSVAMARESPGPAPLLAVTIADACRITGLNRSAVLTLIADGRIRLHRFGRRSVIPFEQLKRVVLGDEAT